MKLLDALQHFDASLRFNYTVPTASKLSKTSRYIEDKIGGDFAGTIVAPQELLVECYDAFQNSDLSVLPQKSLRIFCSAGLPYLVNIEQADLKIRLLLDEIKSRSKTSLFKALFTGYLLIADTDANWAEVLRQFLMKNVAILPGRWQEKIETYGLLSPTPGEQLINAFLDLEVNFIDELKKAGLVGVLATNGIGKSVFKTICDNLSKTDWLFEKNSEDYLNRFFHYVAVDDELRFVGSSNHLAMCKALLLPCDGEDPDQSILLRVKNFLVSHYSDPRVNPGKWGAIPDDIVSIIRRWLIKQAMGLLIEVLNRTADDNHWDVRNDFWSYYLDNDLVDEAWVVFGPEALIHAKDLVRNNPDFSSGSFGAFRRGGGHIQLNHSVLLLRIDSVVVAEWTHNGKVRLWDSEVSHRPRFYQKLYDADALKGAFKYRANEEHSHDRHGNWMRKVDHFISNKTDIKHPLDVMSGVERDQKARRKIPSNTKQVSRKHNLKRESFNAPNTLAAKSRNEIEPKFVNNESSSEKKTQFCRHCQRERNVVYFPLVPGHKQKRTTICFNCLEE